MRVGAVISGLTVATLGRATQRVVAIAALVFGSMLLIAAFMPTFPAMMVAMVGVGAASTVFVAMTNSVLQLRSAPAFRGRVMALFAIAFLGTTPLGSPLIGWIGATYGPRSAFAFGALASIAAAMAALAILSRIPSGGAGREETSPAPAVAPVQLEQPVSA